jgi:hypothetical protein
MVLKTTITNFSAFWNIYPKKLQKENSPSSPQIRDSQNLALIPRNITRLLTDTQANRDLQISPRRGLAHISFIILGVVVFIVGNINEFTHKLDITFDFNENARIETKLHQNIWQTKDKCLAKI